MMNMETILRIAHEVSLSRGPPSSLPDDLEMAALRSRLTAERATIEAAGRIMDVPHDWEFAEDGKWDGKGQCW